MKKSFLLLLLTAAIAICPAISKAADYPAKNRNVTLIVPYAAGGGTDTQARIAAVAMEKVLGTSFNVVNKTGGNGVIGFTEAARARPDGYTLGFLAYPDLVVPPEYKQTRYNADDYIYIGTFNSGPVCLVVGPSENYNTLEEFVAYAKANPGKITINIASDSHKLGVVLFEEAAGIELTTINTRSGSEALNGVLGGHIDGAMIATQFANIALQTNESNKNNDFKVFGITDTQRTDFLPGIPTFKEQGYDAVMLMNRVMVAPKKTKQEQIDVLVEAFKVAVQDPDLQKNVVASGDAVFIKVGDEMKQYIDEQNKVYISTIKNNLDKFK